MGLEGTLYFLVYIICIFIVIFAEIKIKKLNKFLVDSNNEDTVKRIKRIKISRTFGIVILLPPIAVVIGMMVYTIFQ